MPCSGLRVLPRPHQCRQLPLPQHAPPLPPITLPLSTLFAGNAAFSKQSFAIAEACYARASASDPKQPLAISNRALAVMNQGRNDEAMKLFRSALKVDSKSAETYHAMGSLLHATGDTAGAIAAMRSATALNPLLAKAYEHLGGLLIHSNDISAAAAAYERAASLQPTDATTRISYARLLCALGRLTECDEEFSRAKSAAVKAKGKKAAGLVYTEHAMSLKRAGNTAKAEELLLKAIAKDGQLATAYYTLGDIYSGDIYTENKRIPQAMQAHEIATRINPDYAEAYMSLAMLYWGQGALQEAERLLKHSIRSRPLAEAAANLGIVQSDLGKTQDALAAFRQVLMLLWAQRVVFFARTASSCRSLTLSAGAAAEPEFSGGVQVHGRHVQGVESVVTGYRAVSDCPLSARVQCGHVTRSACTTLPCACVPATTKR